MSWWAAMMSRPAPQLPFQLGPKALAVALQQMIARRGEDCDHIENGRSLRHNNCGRWIREWRGDSKRQAWCAALTGWCLQESWYQQTDGLGPMPIVRSNGAKRLFKNVVKAGGELVTVPQPGDVVCWHRGRRPDGRWAWTGHIGLVSRVSPGAGVFWAAEGNVGPKAKVAEFRHHLDDKKLVGFVRI